MPPQVLHPGRNLRRSGQSQERKFLSLPAREFNKEAGYMAGQSQALNVSDQSLVIRKAIPAAADVCGEICFEAFSALANHHSFPQDNSCS
jgi:hypothetical protein